MGDGNLVATAASGVIVLAVVRRKIPGPYRVEQAPVRSLLRYGLPAAGAVLPQVLNLRLDQLIMAPVLSAKDLGLYVVAVAWSYAVNPVLLAIGMVLLPRVAGSVDDTAHDQVLVRAVRVGVWAAIGMVAVVAAITPVAFGLLFPAGFDEAVPAAMLLVVAGGLFGVNFILAEGLRGLGRPRITLYAELTGLAVTCLALGALLPLGIVGAAVASIAGYGAVTATQLRDLRREVPGLRGNVLTWSAATDAGRALIRLIRERSLG